jgi:hypothetical protein
MYGSNIPERAVRERVAYAIGQHGETTAFGAILGRRAPGPHRRGEHVARSRRRRNDRRLPGARLSDAGAQHAIGREEADAAVAAPDPVSADRDGEKPVAGFDRERPDIEAARREVDFRRGQLTNFRHATPPLVQGGQSG